MAMRRMYDEFKPQSEWREDAESHILIIHLPGFSKEQLKITIVGSPRIISVVGERLMVGERWRRFQEEFGAPQNCNLDGARARFDNGALIITIPKTMVDTLQPQPQLPDPDGGSSSLCSACTLPIFSTPSVSDLHDRCANLPQTLLHELHPNHALALVNNPMGPNSTSTCQNCNHTCGTMFYECPSCDFRLDLLCALQITIVHRSHAHRLMAIRLRDSASLTCNACDTKHDPSPSPSPSESESATLSYLCNLCGFWIHPDCASLPNPILHYQHHDHCLFLTYNLPTAADAKCVICNGVPKRTSGVYFCLHCPDYLVHIRCALTRPNIFKPVFIRDAKVADLGRLPLPDAHTSLVPYLREDATTDFQDNLHPHPLIFHKADDCIRASRVCNACVQSVSPPFFSCSHCPDFFLHSCCAHLPSEIRHRAHEQHPLLLSPRAPNSDISAGFSCKGCELRCNGFAYSCETCDNFSMDVVCALINPAVTHESHNKTHILFMCRNTSFGSYERCNCCSSRLNGICYECSICRKFKFHVTCALLTNTVDVEHVFDRHPLQLTTTSPTKSQHIDGGDDDDEEEEDLCEVCEEHIEKEPWYYSCSECKHSFHVDCIPSVDRLSRIKLGSTVHVDGHDCPLTLTRQGFDGCGGLRCGFCGEDFKYSDNSLAYECCNCFTMIHHSCVVKSVLKG